MSDWIIRLSPEIFWSVVSVLALANFSCLYGSLRMLRQTQIIEDTPTSKIRSAAQGYAEFEGIAVAMDGEPVLAPLTTEPCVWYSCKVEELSGNGFNWSELFRCGGSTSTWKPLRNEVSDSIFLLRDKTGECIIDPEGAEVTPRINLRWHGNSPFPTHAPSVRGFGRLHLFSSPRYRYTEKRIHNNDPLYVAGMFVTLGSGPTDFSVEAETRDLLACWKHDKAKLIARFDLNLDGDIDLREWEVARRVARKSIRQTRKAITDQPAMHVTRKPASGQQPYVLSAISQSRLLATGKRTVSLYVLGGLISGLASGWAILLRIG